MKRTLGGVDRRSFLAGLAAGLVGCSTTPGADRVLDRMGFEARYGSGRGGAPVMTVVVVVLDDMSTDLLTHPQRYTPNLDRLAAEGVSFTNARCTVPVCGGSRAGLFFSQYAHRLGVYGNRDSPWMNPSLVPWMDAFRAQGWQHLRIGKIHHVLDPRPDGGADRHFPGQDQAWVPVTRPPAEEQPLSGVVDRFGNHDFGPVARHPSQFADASAVGYARSTLDPATPQLLTVGLADPHMPLYPPADFYAVVPDADTVLVPEAVDGDLDDVPAAHSGMLDDTYFDAIRAVPGALEELQRAWLATIAYLDWCLGLLLGDLDLDQTVVVVTSDHGYTTGQLGSVGKVARFDRMSRVPLLIAAPSWPRGLRISQPVSLVDVGPTVQSLAGVAPPLGWPTDGVDLSPLVLDPEATRDPVVTLTRMQPGDRRYSVFGPQWSMHETRNGVSKQSGVELYDTWADPENRDNRYVWPLSPAMRTVYDRLDAFAPSLDDAVPPLGLPGGG